MVCATPAKRFERLQIFDNHSYKELKNIYKNASYNQLVYELFYTLHYGHKHLSELIIKEIKFRPKIQFKNTFKKIANIIEYYEGIAGGSKYGRIQNEIDTAISKDALFIFIEKFNDIDYLLTELNFHENKYTLLLKETLNKLNHSEIFLIYLIYSEKFSEDLFLNFINREDFNLSNSLLSYLSKSENSNPRFFNRLSKINGIELLKKKKLKIKLEDKLITPKSNKVKVNKI